VIAAGREHSRAVGRKPRAWHMPMHRYPGNELKLNIFRAIARNGGCLRRTLKFRHLPAMHAG